MSEQEIDKIKDIICNNYCIKAIIEATEDVLQRYADKEVKTIAMATAYEHIRGVMNETDSIFTDPNRNTRTNKL
jgi:hypothetical protein